MRAQTASDFGCVSINRPMDARRQRQAVLDLLFKFHVVSVYAKRPRMSLALRLQQPFESDSNH